jgi:hypothetical protein
VEKGICFQPGLLYFPMCFFINFRLLGRLSGVDANFRLCLLVDVYGSWLTVADCRVLVVDCAGCRSVLPLFYPSRVGKLPAMRDFSEDCRLYT